MKEFIPIVFVGVIYALLGLPHIAVLLFCRRSCGPKLSLVRIFLSYSIALLLSCGIVYRASEGATGNELLQFFVPFALVVLFWWTIIYLPLRRVRGVGQVVKSGLPALFVPAVFVAPFFSTIPTFKWHLGTFTEKVQIELGTASWLTWHACLVVAIAVMVYTRTQLASRLDRWLDRSTTTLCDDARRGTDTSAPLQVENPYAAPHSHLE